MQKRDGMVAYYLATPLFTLEDYAFGLPVRIANLNNPIHHNFYYVTLIAYNLLYRTL